MKLINLVKHPVVIYNPRMGDQEIVIPSSGEARVDSQLVRLAEVTDDATGMAVPLISFENDFVYGLPEPKEGVLLIVSKAVRVAHPTRYDLASPDVTSSDTVYEDGRIRSVPGLVVNRRI